MKTYIIHYYINDYKFWETVTLTGASKKEVLDYWYNKLIYMNWSVKRSTMWAEKI